MAASRQGVFLSKEELAALCGLPYFCVCLYVQAIRPRMDGCTGLVGVRPRISWRALTEWLYVEPGQGIEHSGAPSVARVRRAIAWLKKGGLLANSKSARGLVFSCPLAPVGQSAQNKPGRDPGREPGRAKGDIIHLFSDTCVQDEEKPGREPGREPGTHLRKGFITTPNGVVVGNAVPNCPHKEIVALYHECLPMCPTVRSWGKTRQGYLQARWREDAKRQSLDWWRGYFKYVADSRFLTGRVSRPDKPPFVASLEWLVRPENFAKVIEGTYHR